MKAEIITIGEEILSGQTVDSNSACIARNLSEIGIEVGWKTSVGDRSEDIAAAILTAWDRAQVSITTGGLGPTADDITKRSICAAFSRKLVFHDEILQALQKRYRERGVTMPAQVQNQALQPQGVELLENRIGSAAGILIRESNHLFFSLPGVPSEMEAMLEWEVIPRLKALPGRDHIEIRLIRTVGITESEISERIGDLQPSGQSLRLAYLPDYKGVDLRITGCGPDSEEVRPAVEELCQAIVEQLGEYVFTVGEKPLSEVVSALLLEKRVTLATAESCTGGLLAKMLTDMPGSSGYFLGSIVAYSNELKQNLLKVPTKLIAAAGAVSPEVAEEMARNMQRITGADLAVSTTGIAGPSGAGPEKPVGLVYLGLADSTEVSVRKLNLMGTRRRVRERTCLMGLDMLRRRLLER